MYSRVTERHSAAVIVASGPSARHFSPPADLPVIAVNGAIDRLPRADYWFTLDPSALNQARMARPRPGTTYYCAAPRTVSLPGHVRRLRRITGGGPWGARYRLSREPDAVHTGNSAWGAAGLAYLMGAERVALVGVDATQEQRCEGGRPLDLGHLPELFASGREQLAMVSCGQLASVPQMDIDHALEWLRG